MKRYLKIYLYFLKLNFSVLIAYRGNFISNLISSLAWGIFSIISIVLLTSKSPQILGWNREEIIFLTATYALLIGLFHMIFSRNFERFSQLVHFGELDALLLKPMDSQFLVSFGIVNYMQFARVLIGFCFALFLTVHLNWQVGLLSLITYLILLFLGLMLLYSVWMIVLTSMIWHTHLSNLVEVMYTVSGIGRMPKEVFYEVNNFLFFILLPVTLTVNTPARAILQKPLFADMATMTLLTIGLFLFCRKYWHYALRFYTSASG